jgi:hypothetical protein
MHVRPSYISPLRLDPYRTPYPTYSIEESGQDFLAKLGVFLAGQISLFDSLTITP